MTVYLTIAAVAVFVLVYPHLRILVKRIALAIRLPRFCRRLGVTMTVTSPLWFLAANRAARPVLYLETAARAWAVALFAVPRRRSSLILGEGNWVLETYMRLWGGGWAGYTFHSKPHPRPTVSFASLPDAMLVKHLTPVILVQPGCLAMRLTTAGRPRGQNELGDGDFFDGAAWCSFGRLRAMIEHAAVEHNDWRLS